MGLSDVLPKLKGENKAPPPPPSPSCNVVSLFELPVENNKHPYFEWRGGEGRGVDWFFFLKLPYLSAFVFSENCMVTMSQQFCRRL